MGEASTEERQIVLTLGRASAKSPTLPSTERQWLEFRGAWILTNVTRPVPGELRWAPLSSGHRSRHRSPERYHRRLGAFLYRRRRLLATTTSPAARLATNVEWPSIGPRKLDCIAFRVVPPRRRAPESRGSHESDMAHTRHRQHDKGRGDDPHRSDDQREADSERCCCGTGDSQPEREQSDGHEPVDGRYPC
jgi:hypothetical protein